MLNTDCSCCGTDDAEASGDADERWLTETPVTDAPVPDDVRAAMESFLGVDAPNTLGDCVDELREQGGGSAVTVDHLCHSSEPTPHWGEVDGERNYFRCFYDAVALAELVDSPVDVRTEGPDGTVIEARASGDGDLEVTPSDAVLSFGIAEGVGTAPDGGPSLEELYVAVCPYVKAFPDRASYEEWAATAPAATVGMPFVDGIDAATRLVERT